MEQIDLRKAKGLFSSSGDDKLVTLFFYLMKELKIDFFTLAEMPVPAIFALQKELEKHVKKEQAESKKASKKR